MHAESDTVFQLPYMGLTSSENMDNGTSNLSKNW